MTKESGCTPYAQNVEGHSRDGRNRGHDSDQPEQTLDHISEVQHPSLSEGVGRQVALGRWQVGKCRAGAAVPISRQLRHVSCDLQSATWNLPYNDCCRQPDRTAAPGNGGGKSELRRAVCRITSGRPGSSPVDGKCHRKHTAPASL